MNSEKPDVDVALLLAYLAMKMPRGFTLEENVVEKITV